MAEGTDKIEEGVRTDREEIYSKAVRAGKRTYFFDVKTTRRNDYYLTLTESKKRFNRDGRFYFEKHKIFLYKEDFEKFIDGLTDAIGYIKENAPEVLDPVVQENAEPVSEIPAKEAPFNEAPPEEKETPEEKATAKKTGDEESLEETDVESEAQSEAQSEVESEVGEPITENFSNVEFEDLEDSGKS
jgi:hypothetical protein